MNTDNTFKFDTHQLRWLGISLLVIWLDHMTKVWAAQLLPMHEPKAIMPFFNLFLAHNTGAAFSFLQDAGGWQRWFFAAIAVFFSIILMRWLLRLPRAAHWSAAAISAILGGALGNLWDRLEHGYVIDFLQVYYQSWYWPTFNLADSAITVGAAIVVIRALMGEKNL